MARRVWTAGLAAAGVATAALALDGGTPPSPQGVMSDKQTTSGAKAPEEQGTFTANRVTGHLTSIDSKAHRLTIDEGGKPQSLTFGDNATVFVDGRLGSIADLKEGQEVRAAYREDGDKKDLRWLDVMGKSTTPDTTKVPEQPTAPR